MDFARNEGNPLECDVIIVDEMSMVDLYLMHALLKAIMVGTRVIFVGDINQLPSVGAGNVLKDMIASERFAVVKLARIFRQSAESNIILNAGQSISLDNHNNKDFFFLNRNDNSIIIEAIIYLVQTKISRYVQVSPYEVQVLTPMKAGELGTEKLNIEDMITSVEFAGKYRMIIP